MSKYGLLDPGTCIPVLEVAFAVYQIDTVLEFGCGIWSTGCFVRNSKHITSIENVEEWVEFVKKEYNHKNNLDVIHYTKPMNEYFNETKNSYDLIFIDGNERKECLQSSFYRSPIIVCHDMHASEFKWQTVNVPSDYNLMLYTGCEPYITGIFGHKDISLKQNILNRKNYKHRNTYIDESFWVESR
jgi:hypothetical protein